MTETLTIPSEERREELLGEYLVAGRSSLDDQEKWVKDVQDPVDRRWIEIISEVSHRTVQMVSDLIQQPEDPEKGWFN